MSRGIHGLVREFRFRAPLLALALETAAFALACRLVDTADFRKTSGDSMLAAALGDIRVAIGDAFYEEADTFFHKGIGHYRPKAFSDVFIKLGQNIAPTGHAHLSDENVAEIVPWLYFATRMDPRNVTAYAVAAFWLAGEAGRPDLAERVLADARRANPRDYRVYLESGRLAIKQGNLIRATRLLEMGLALWPGKPDGEDRQSKLDQAGILMYLGLLSEHDGDLVRAQAMYRRVLERFPGRGALQERLAFIEKHDRSPSPPFEIWQSMLFHHAEVCDNEKAEERK